MAEGLLSRSEAVAFAHAVAQVVAEDNAVDLLHIKGPALDASLRSRMGTEGRPLHRLSVDADVLVRPAHVARFAEALIEKGWRRYFDFADGSAFEHAATWGNERVGFLDVHRFFPGIELEASAAFDILWTHRQDQSIAGIPCAVPDLPAQRLIMIIHAAREAGPRSIADIDTAWGLITSAERQAVEELAGALDARIALYAGTGRLDELAGAHSYRLWRELINPSSSLISIWWARVSAEPDAARSLRKALQLVLPNRRRMETWLGRPPTRREVLHAYWTRIRLGARAVGAAVENQRHRRR